MPNSLESLLINDASLRIAAKVGGRRIVETFVRFAKAHQTSIPFSFYPSTARSKSEVVESNLRRFPKNIQVQIIYELCLLNFANNDMKKLTKEIREITSDWETEASPTRQPVRNKPIAATENPTPNASVNRVLQIFLCHSSPDKQMVRKISENLRSRGHRPWLDEDSLVPGQNWESEIRSAIRDSDILIICISTNSTTRKGYMQREIKLALKEAELLPKGAIYIIPAKIEECELPDELSEYHSVDLFSSNGYSKLDQAITSVAKSVGR